MALTVLHPEGSIWIGWKLVSPPHLSVPVLYCSDIVTIRSHQHKTDEVGVD
jgi:hypothetical protein